MRIGGWVSRAGLRRIVYEVIRRVICFENGATHINQRGMTYRLNSLPVGVFEVFKLMSFMSTSPPRLVFVYYWKGCFFLAESAALSELSRAVAWRG